jgi:uncharacterized membrane protein YgdD (TMEM256/DUF423 family)
MAAVTPEVRGWLALAGVNGALAVAFGAFAAHGVGETLSPARLDWLNTASRYQLVHGLALIGIAWARTIARGWTLAAAGAAFLVGVVLFSGGLYVAALTGWRGIIPVVPIGGAGYIAGWLFIIAAAVHAPARS